jgi:type II secretory pathway pseudopilin PulG
MATRNTLCGSQQMRGPARTIAAASGRRACGASLIELLVVLFIISIMFGLLFPAIQSARHKAQTTACLNNVRQLQMGVSRYGGSGKRFPLPNKWTCDILKFVEEWPLADEVASGVPAGAKLPRPSLMRCPMQNDPSSTVEEVGVCHYVLVVDRSKRYPYQPISPWEIQDRDLLSDDNTLEPWYVGPEIDIATQQQWFAARSGPHSTGAFCMGSGEVRGSE